ncbi:MAG: TIGR03546 family protein [Acidobacteriota bacterium]
MFWLKFITNFIKILRAGQTPRQIAGGFALGSILGLSPHFTLQNIAIWVILLVLDVNLSAATVAITTFALIAFIFDPAFHRLGYFILVEIPSLQPFWTELYNAPLAPLTKFNNTVVMGSFAGAIVLFLPVYFGMKQFVIQYRAHLYVKIERWKVYQTISKSSLVQWYQRVRDLGGLR